MTDTSHQYTNHDRMVTTSYTDDTPTTPSSSHTTNAATHNATPTYIKVEGNASSSDVTDDTLPDKGTMDSTTNVINLAQQRKCKLKFFRNQVAGHNALLWDSGTVCKPLIPAEYDFYSTVENDSPALIPFVPKYYGIMSVDKTVVNDTADNEFELSVDDLSNATCTLNNNNAQRPQSADSDVGVNPDAGTPPNGEPLSDNDRFNYNRWAYKCLQQQKKKKEKQKLKPQPAGSTSTHRQYIVLEDLTFAYSKPSILDLKLGTRQHGEHDSPAKIESKMQRCAATTSGAIGLRLCGMQVYKPSQQRNIYRDKYYGRSLDVIAFKQSLKEYFWNGQQYRTDVMHAFVQRLQEFRQALIDEPRYRFYSSSLLMVYEGEDSVSPVSTSPTTSPILQSSVTSTSPTAQPQSIDLNADTVMQQSDDTQLMPPPQSSVNRSQSTNLTHSVSMPISLKTQLAAAANTAVVDHANHNTSSSSTSLSATNKSASQQPNHAALTSTWPFLHNRPPPKIYARKRKTTHAQAKERARLRGGIDIRIIDFAHTMKVPASSTQQDSGLLLGFSNLIQYITELLEVAERQHKRSSSDVSSYVSGGHQGRTLSHHDLSSIVEQDDSLLPGPHDKLHLPDGTASSRQLWRSTSDMVHSNNAISNDFKHEQQELHA